MNGPTVPFREIVLKVHARCDLACDHCYIYEHADQSWRTRPKVISDRAVERTALRLAEHAGQHGLPSVSVILHGGEPLLAGPARLRRICEEFTAALDGVAELDLRIHTNGLQLGPRYLDLFAEYGVGVGVSLDGDRAANDRHRRFADGRTSHPLVLRALELLREPRYRHLCLGLLCTVDTANDPVAVHDALAALEPPRIDFLLPHATWDTPPARPGGSPTAYADWLLAVFDRWDTTGRRVPVRLFDSVFSTLAGGPSLTESLGLAPSDLVVVETDGSLEQVDSLKSAYDGAAATGFDVFRHSFDEVAAHPGVRARQRGLDGVCGTCRKCPVVRSCGGGLYTHRYRSTPGTAPGGGFDHTSVYCTDLKALIRGIESRVSGELAPPAVTEPGALLAGDQDLTRLLAAALNAELDGAAGPEWDEGWRLAVTLEDTGELLDAVWAHPYTRTWLEDALTAHRAGRTGAAGPAGGLPARLAAALAAAGTGPAVRVRAPGGVLRLPGLGELTLPRQSSGTPLLLRPGPGAFTLTGPGTDRRVPLTEEGGGWRPVRTLGGRDGVPVLRLDDLDPYRDCHGAPAAPRLGAAETARWDRLLTGAWALLGEHAPARAAELADCLTTLTPLTAPPAGPPPRAHGLGALGLHLPATAAGLAGLLLTGYARTRITALHQICELYAHDGEWRHRAPWSPEEVTVSELLTGTAERTALAPLDPRAADEARQALAALTRAAELTVAGRRLADTLGKELAEAGRG
jgi:uncharacterized protein